MVRVFANDPDQGSIPDQVIPKTQKLVLDASLLPKKEVAPFTTPQWSSY